MSELAQEIASLAEKLAAYGVKCGATDAEGILRVLLCDSIIAVTVNLDTEVPGEH
jgi:hypothetical protein